MCLNRALRIDRHVIGLRGRLAVVDGNRVDAPAAGGEAKGLGVPVEVSDAKFVSWLDTKANDLSGRASQPDFAAGFGQGVAGAIHQRPKRKRAATAEVGGVLVDDLPG